MNGITSLCVSGGIVSPYVVLGFLSKLEKADALSSITSYSSTGNGCLFSVCLCLGMTTAEIVQYLDIYSLLRDSYTNSISASKVNSVTNYDRVRTLFKSILLTHTPIPPTFKQLYLTTGKELYLSAYNKTSDSHTCFSRDTTPNANVLDAICLSCCYTTQGYEIKYNEEVYSDACYFNPLPVTCFKKRSRILAIRSSYTSTPIGDGTCSDLLMNCELSQLSMCIFSISSRKEALLVRLDIPLGSEDANNLAIGYGYGKEFLKEEELDLPSVLRYP